MRTLTTATGAAVAATVTTPAWLVEIEMASQTIRLSSRGDQTWAGAGWLGGRLGKITGLAWDGAGEQRGRLDLINTDSAYLALFLNESPADRPVRIWQFYGDAPAEADPVLVFDGVGDSVEISPATGVVQLAVVTGGSATETIPRQRIGPGTGFNHLRQEGARATWGGEVYVLERRP